MATRRLASLVVYGAIVLACGKKPPPKAPLLTVSDRCPDLTKADEVAAFDFAKEYALSREAGDKLKAAALAATEIATLTDKLDADFGIACAQVAHDLGNKGDWRSGNDACAAAIKAVEDARAKLGPKVQTQLVVRQPLCLVDAALLTKCASICDSSVPAGKVRATCEQMAGRCDGNCEGVCEPKAGVKCDGTCSGTCEGTTKGTCGGRCNGTCDGRRVNGGCLGTCIGTCDKGAMNGECKGTCTGSCKSAKPTICDGICSGGCSVELTDSKCSGDFKAPEVSADCHARCDLALMNKTECSTPQVGLAVVGGKDRETAEAMKMAVEKAFPALLRPLAEMGESGAKRVYSAQALIEGARTGFKELARSGSAASAASSEAQLSKCFDEPFKKASATAASVKAGIEQAQSVRDAMAGAATEKKDAEKKPH